MKTIFEKWWDKGNKCFSVANYKESWSKNGNGRVLKFFTNGAIKGKHSCLDVHLIIGYVIINYTNFSYSR